jgi:hypothetical protein
LLQVKSEIFDQNGRLKVYTDADCDTGWVRHEDRTQTATATAADKAFPSSSRTLRYGQVVPNRGLARQPFLSSCDVPLARQSCSTQRNGYPSRCPLLPWPANGLRGVSRCSVSEEPLDDVWLLLAALQVCT